ncbi:MAG: hypothetical protein ACFBSG_11705 [Leptolyngbyaceae cyanobacterium]
MLELGELYLALAEFDQAKRYFRKALDCAEVLSQTQRADAA